MNIMSRLMGKVFRRAERWLGRNHYNPIASLYVNLRLLPFARALKLPISVYGWPCLMDLSGRVRFTCPVRRGLVKLNPIDCTPGQRGSKLELAIAGEICFGGAALIRSNTKIYVDDKARLLIGHNLRLGAGIIINCLNEIEIGEGVRIGHRSQLLDSNLHYMVDVERHRVVNHKKKIVIGAHSWLTNSVTVYGGAVLPAYSVVASGTVLNKDLSGLGENHILGGMPCKVISTGLRLVNNYEKERELDRFYRANPAGNFPVENPIRDEDWFINS